MLRFFDDLEKGDVLYTPPYPNLMFQSLSVNWEEQH